MRQMTMNFQKSTTQWRMMGILATTLTILRRVGMGMILGILTMGFNKASKAPRLHLTNPQNKLLYPPLHWAL